MKLVVDASVALKWVLPEPDSDAADALLLSDEELVGPDFWLNEATNALWVHVRQRKLAAEEARTRLSRLNTVFPRTSSSTMDLHANALEIALAVACSPYDALYAAFALAVGADHVIAADQPFLTALRRHPDPAVARLALDLHDWAAK